MSVEQKPPLFSILSVIKNVTSREAMFRRSIESVLGQTCGDFEFVIQDGGSTDATADIVAEYRDSRIRFFSEPDGSPEEGFFRGLKQCRGAYIGSCLSDEELSPDALENARRGFAAHSHMAGFYGNVAYVDEDGHKSRLRVPPHPFSIEEYVRQTLVPPLCSSFFQREALVRAGLHEHPWRYGIGEFEFWIRTAGQGDILYLPYDISYFGRHPQSNTCSVGLYDRLVAERERVLPDLFRENPILQTGRVTVEQAIAGNYLWGAQGIFNIEGPSTKCEQFVRQAERYDLANPRLEALKKKMRGTQAVERKNDGQQGTAGVRAASRQPIVATEEFRRWLETLSSLENRLYYRDQSPETLAALCSLARDFDPTVIVELGTLGGLSLRAWLAGSERARVVAVDLSFAKFAQTRRVLPVDVSRVTFLEQDILKTDFSKLWTAQDRVIFFVDAHDLPGVPIMEHVLTNVVPSLPEGSLVVVDDLWFSSQRLERGIARAFLENHVLDEIDGLQCFEGHYAPYHEGGSFLGFAEVIPLLAFVNEHGVPLVYEKGAKHVFFAWRREYLSRAGGHGGPRFVEPQGCRGMVLHNPLELVPASTSLRESLRSLADAYLHRKTGQVAECLEQLVAKHPQDEGLLYGLAVCRARLGRLSEARDVLEGRVTTSSHPRLQRLLGDLVRRVGPGSSHPNRKSEEPRNSCGLTLFAMPKPFVGHAGVIQKNAIRSWARLPSGPEIILFGNEQGTREMAEEIGARHIPEVSRNEYGTPLVNELFRAAQDHASHQILAYVNADMILLPDFMQAVDKVRSRFSEFLLIGQRWDLTVLDEIDFCDPQWEKTLCRRCEEHAFSHGECGLDYFVFRAGCWPEIPPFAIGRTAWDNWLVVDPKRRGVAVIDGTDFVTAVHQDHTYGHVAGGRRDAWHGVEAARNHSLAGAMGDAGRTSATPWVLQRDGDLVEMPPREPVYKTATFKNDRSHWLFDDARELAAKGRVELAACKCEEAIELANKVFVFSPADSEYSAQATQRYVACQSLLADCCLQMDRPEQAVAAYTQLLENRHIEIPASLRGALVRMRDGLARLSQDRGKSEKEEEGTESRGQTASLPPRPSVAPPVDLTTIKGGRPKVAVVTACRDGEKYLVQCIESVLKQTMSEWELLLLDDGSSDGTRRIMQEYARRDPRIHAHCFDDSKGPYIRRNFAIEQAAAPFIVIQDSDDLMCPDKLARLHDAISQDDRLAVVGSFYRIFLDDYHDLQHTENVTPATSQENILQGYRTYGICDWCWHGSAIMRKRVLEEVGLYDENPFGSDSFLLGKVAEYAFRNKDVQVRNIPEYLTIRRMHAESQVSRLPVFDPRSRRMWFSAYRRREFAELTARLDADPKADVRAELRKTACSNFTKEFGHLFASWESQPLTSPMVDSFLKRIHDHFTEGQFVRCIVTCGIVERLVEGVSRMVRCYDLIRGAAYFALGLSERSRECLTREFEVHGTRVAKDCCVAWLDRYNPSWSRRDRVEIIAKSLFGGGLPGSSDEASEPAVRLLLDRREAPQVGMSVIVSCGEDVRLWRQCAAALNAQTAKDFEVIVLTAERSAGEAEALAQDLAGRAVVLAEREQANPLRRKNLAVDYARGQYVAFLAEGVLPEPRFVEAVLRRFASHEANGLRGRILSDGAASPVGFDLGADVTAAACDLDEMCVFRRDVFLRLGGYAVTPFRRGALPLSYRIYADREMAGRPILYCPDVVARHVRLPQSQGDLIDPFALESRLCINHMAGANQLSREQERDLLAFLDFAKGLHAMGTQTAGQRYLQALSIAQFLEKRCSEWAIPWAEKAKAFHPDALKARYTQGSAYVQLKRWEQAASCLEKILRPLETLLTMGPATQSKAEFSNRVVLGEYYVSACTLLAQCHTETQQHERVAAVYSRLIENPSISLSARRREEILGVLRALAAHSSSGPRGREANNAVSAGTVALADAPASVATSSRKEPTPAGVSEAKNPIPREFGVSNGASEDATEGPSGEGEYGGVFVGLERKFRSMSQDSPAKQTLAVRISELARRTGSAEKSRAFQIAAEKIRNRMEHEKARRSKPAVCRHKPIAVEFNVIMRCNAGCIMCDYSPQGEILPLDRFKSLADQLLPTAEEVLLIGGEVLLHPDFYRICEYAHSFGVSLRMTTNLHTLEGDRQAAVDRFINELKVSIDGATQSTYESIRTHLSFDRLLKNLDTVSRIRRRRSDFQLLLTCVAMRQNVHELPGVIELANRYGFDGVEVNFVQARSRLSLDDSLLFHRDEANRYFDLARERAAALGVPLRIPANFDLTRSPSLRPERLTDAYRSCLRPWQRVRVLVTGEVVPCCHLHDVPVGNVFTQSFDEIWDGPRYRELRESIRTGSGPMPQRCKHCQLLGKKTDSNDAMLHITPEHVDEMRSRLAAESGTPAANAQVPDRPAVAPEPEIQRFGPPAEGPNPKVSVIMACHNSEAYLAECLDTLRNQTLQEWELLLVDDGSTDGTREIFERYRSLDPRIHAFCFDRNEGPYVRRRWAIQRANSDFIVIQDSDDLMCPSKLERLHSEISQDPRLAVVASQYRTFVHEFRGEKHTELTHLSLDPAEIVEKCATWGHGFSHISAVIRREMFELIGPYDGNPFGSDSFWSAKLGEYIRQGAPWTVRNIPDCLTFVRIHGENQTQQLPAIDCRGRRWRYFQYCEYKLRAIRETMRRTPNVDPGAELRQCDCSDFLVRFKAMILAWESEPLAPGALPILLNSSVCFFDEGHFVNCVSLLNRIEVMQPDVAGRVVHFDLLKAMAFHALDLKERSRAQLQRELENHDDSLAREFLSEFLEQNGTMDLRRWRKERGDRFVLVVHETGAVPSSRLPGPKTRRSTSEIRVMGR